MVYIIIVFVSPQKRTTAAICYRGLTKERMSCLVRLNSVLDAIAPANAANCVLDDGIGAPCLVC